MAEERAQRRLAAILAADVVGYSRLMQADEAGTLAALKARRIEVLQPTVTKHRGRVVKLMGDGVLVEFGSAVNAVECAVALQQAMNTANRDLPEDRRIVLRVGINLGDVIVEGSDLYGDGVNIAARLQALAEPGSVLVAEAVVTHVRGKVQLSFEDLGERNLKNMAGAVRLHRVTSGVTSPIGTRPGKSAQPSRPSVAVLPFTNMSDETEQQYFSDGITEDIITELSRFHSLSVIARNSSFAFKDRSIKVQEIARELAVAYVVEGSVRRAGDRVRITAQLVEAGSGNHVWAERYDRDLRDLFAVQDEVVQAIVSSLAIRLETGELEMAKRRAPQDLRAYDLWLSGRQCFHRWTPEGNAEARRFFKEAIALDPTFARAYAGLAGTYSVAIEHTAWAPDVSEPQSAALESARRAVALDDTDHQPHIFLASIYHRQRQFDLARRHLDRALALNPNDADGLAERSRMLTCQGEPEAGRACAEAAIRLNPNHPDYYLLYLALSQFLTGNYSEAIRLQAVVVTGFPDRYAVQAAIYAHAGDLHTAAERVQEFLRQYSLHWKEPPSARQIANIFAFKRQEDADLMIEGLRKAGLPD